VNCACSAAARADGCCSRGKISTDLHVRARQRTVLDAVTRPGPRKAQFMKDLGSKTRYPGVYRLDKHTYRIKAKYRDPRTGKDKWLHRMLEGVSAQEAAAERKRLLAEVKRGGQRGRRLKVSVSA
jgi:hypothetical protein